MQMSSFWEKDPKAEKMSKYNIMPKEVFESLTKKDPKFILKYMMEFAEASRQNPDITLVVPFSSIPKRPVLQENVAIKDFGWLFAGEGRCRDTFLPADDVMLKNMKRFLQDYDFSFDGYVAAGSSVILACLGLGSTSMARSPTPHDIDMFPFYDPTLVSQIPQDQVMEIYTRFIGEMNELCETSLEDRDRGEDENDACKFHGITITRRTEYCTTIYCANFGISEIQIIHRAYSSPVATVVGFDQPACKAFFDGEMAYFTIDAALCLYFGINPIDWRRESPTHLRRADKYMTYGFSPIFPGLPFLVGEKIMQKDSEKDNTLRSYRLPGCELMPRSQHRSSKKKKDCPPPIPLVFSFRDNWENPVSVNEKDHEKPENQQQYRGERGGGGDNESDYDMEGPYVHDNMAYFYRGLSMLVKEKRDFIPVFSKMPLGIISECSVIPIKMILDKVYSGHYSRFYLGSVEVFDTYFALTKLKLKANSSRNYVSFKILRGKDKKKALELEDKIEELVEKRCEELEKKANEHLNTMKGQVRFITTNPGSQFTSSFHPIIRRNAREYWGSMCKRFDCYDFNKIKLTVLCMKKFRKCVWSKMDNNVIKIIFNHLYSSHFLFLATPEQIQGVPFALQNQSRRVCCHNLLPWIESIECRCEEKPTEILELPRVNIMNNPFLGFGDAPERIFGGNIIIGGEHNQNDEEEYEPEYDGVNEYEEDFDDENQGDDE